jgi:hypothetical protein
MINQEELVICRRRGHTIRVIDQNWKHCKACGMWVREVTMTEEREEPPPEKDIAALVKLGRKYGGLVAKEGIDPAELAICRRRGHDRISDGEDWSLCRACGTWLREKRTIEEQEEKPPAEGGSNGQDRLKRELDNE